MLRRYFLFSSVLLAKKLFAQKPDIRQANEARSAALLSKIANGTDLDSLKREDLVFLWNSMLEPTIMSGEWCSPNGKNKSDPIHQDMRQCAEEEFQQKVSLHQLFLRLKEVVLQLYRHHR